MTDPSSPSSGPLSRPSLGNPAVLLATVFGIGLLPKAPGTWASLAALPAGWWIMAAGGMPALGAAILAVFVIGVWACSGYEKATGHHDAGACVIDEVAGQWIVLLITPPDPLFYAGAFLLFRFFDIVKPWPTGWADETVHGGIGVMLDDVFAGLQGATVMALTMAGLTALGVWP
jgi:phosphatidylglycerophosphatase A